jgi:hypothetical protein
MPTKLIRNQFLLTEAENERLEREAIQKSLSVSNLTRVRHGLKPLEVGRKSIQNKAPRQRGENKRAKKT